MVNIGWNEPKNKIENMYIISYIDYLKKIFMVFNKDDKTNDEIYSGKTPTLEIGKLYYFKNTQKNTFPPNFYNRWILCRFRNVNDERFKDVYIFEFINKFDDERSLLKNTRLKLFENVINDNKYFTKIPKTNEIFHFDSALISNNKIILSFELSNFWDSFYITHKTRKQKGFSVLKFQNNTHKE